MSKYPPNYFDPPLQNIARLRRSDGSVRRALAAAAAAS
jgi:hypothetical protein